MPLTPEQKAAIEAKLQANQSVRFKGDEDEPIFFVSSDSRVAADQFPGYCFYSVTLLNASIRPELSVMFVPDSYLP